MGWENILKWEIRKDIQEFAAAYRVYTKTNIELEEHMKGAQEAINSENAQTWVNEFKSILKRQKILLEAMVNVI